MAGAPKAAGLDEKSKFGQALRLALFFPLPALSRWERILSLGQAFGSA